ncbi:polysaccharide deacetylase family protein [Paenibacillus qinlingensis]|uniref:Peptidoglycan/xylan/chitin deacetylase (PgdA/CDA1 family) n=1 Tax=Paenibacillus qinlingensis TaxID=1837343 RepID=A0ABU1NNP2_9BACL|nr:polysaccharide deacetylase family protein [Paenibacillus qinlingensis]MDR6549085.1 peptidoglycan/xylan/chitin deacetylase (PgdA/CDA1 family) [Paenibacillus qinlingensis]
MNIIKQVSTTQKAIAFTFDDGPNPEYTPQLLDIFEEVSGRATFFMMGKQMELYPETALDVHIRKHEIGNHTYSHPFMTQISLEACEQELLDTDRLITQVTGSRPVVMRPPYLDYNLEVHEITAKFDYQVIGALNGGTRDWEMPGVEHILEVTREHIGCGSIFLFHDGFEDRSQTVEAVRILAKELTELGYQLVTVSELLQMAESE